MEQNALRIALIGCGRWGRHILRDLTSLGCEVVVVTVSETSLENARSGGASAIVSSIGELPDSVDGAVVAVPTVSHFTVIRELMERFEQSVPIFCEKPLCIDLDEIRFLQQHMAGKLFVMHKWRYHQGILELARLAREEYLGPVTGLRLTRIAWGNPHQDVDPVWILLPHDLSITLEILGYLPPPLSALLDQSSAGVHGMTATLASEQHHVSLEVSERSPANRREAVVYFEGGIAQLTNSYSDSIEVYRTDPKALRTKPDAEHIKFDNEMPLLRELRAFTNYLRGDGSAPRSSVDEELNVIKTICELRGMGGSNRC